MKSWIADLFSQSPRVSETRVMCMMICAVGCYVVIDGLMKTPVDYPGVAMLSGSLFGIALSGKVAGRYAEVADKKAGTVVKTTEVNN